MTRKRTSSTQTAAVASPPVDTFYRISERLLLTTIRGPVAPATIEDAIKQIRSELGKFPGDIRPMIWALDALDVTAFDALGIQEPSRRLAALVKESVGDHVVLIRTENGDNAARSPFIMFLRGLMFGAQLKLRVVPSHDELAQELNQLRKERDGHE